MELQYLKDERGKTTAVLVPIKEWEDLMDHKAIVEGLKDEFSPWEQVSKRLLNSAKRKEKKKQGV